MRPQRFKHPPQERVLSWRIVVFFFMSQVKSGAMLESRASTGCWRGWEATCPKPEWWPVSVKAWPSVTSSWPWDARDWSESSYSSAGQWKATPCRACRMLRGWLIWQRCNNRCLISSAYALGLVQFLKPDGCIEPVWSTWEFPPLDVFEGRWRGKTVRSSLI